VALPLPVASTAELSTVTDPAGVGLPQASLTVMTTESCKPRGHEKIGKSAC